MWTPPEVVSQLLRVRYMDLGKTGHKQTYPDAMKEEISFFLQDPVLRESI